MWELRFGGASNPSEAAGALAFIVLTGLLVFKAILAQRHLGEIRVISTP